MGLLTSISICFSPSTLYECRDMFYGSDIAKYELNNLWLNTPYTGSGSGRREGKGFFYKINSTIWTPPDNCKKKKNKKKLVFLLSLFNSFYPKLILPDKQPLRLSYFQKSLVYILFE